MKINNCACFADEFYKFLVNIFMNYIIIMLNSFSFLDNLNK